MDLEWVLSYLQYLFFKAIFFFSVATEKNSRQGKVVN